MVGSYTCKRFFVGLSLRLRDEFAKLVEQASDHVFDNTPIVGERADPVTCNFTFSAATVVEAVLAEELN